MYHRAVRPTLLPWCLVLARLCAACGGGNVSGDPSWPIDQDAYPIGQPDRDDWNELDTGCAAKGGCVDAAVARDRGGSDAAAGDIPAALDPCRSREDGTYCAALLGLPSTGLLRCASNRSAELTACPAGCLDRPGATDACLDDAVDPCFDERDGLYCGRAIGATMRPDDAFRCRYRRTAWSGRCAGGCAMGAGGLMCSP